MASAFFTSIAKSNLTPRDQAQRLISEIIGTGEPSLICRFGSTEFKVGLAHYIDTRLEWPTKAIIRTRLAKFLASSGVRNRNLRIKSGFFPEVPDAIREFAELFIQDLCEVNLLGAWNPGEAIVANEMPHANFTALSSLSPLSAHNPWTLGLSGKRVLVIHPFSRSISEQYEKREKLFDRPILPDFELSTLEAVQSLGGEANGFRSWFEALDFMANEALSHEFDVALLGCGAYGFPLGARIKRAGKTAIVMGGGLQLLFGIKGKRWDNDGLYNEYWVRPLESERPKGYLGADQGAYW